MSAQNCATNLGNNSKTNCTLSAGQVVGMWLDELETGVSFANAELQDTWTTKINATRGSRMFVLTPNMPDDATRNVEESVIRVGSTGKRRKARNGKADYVFGFGEPTDCQIAYLKSFDGAKGYAYFITKNEMIKAGDNGTNLIPQEVEIYVDEVMSPESEDEIWMLNVRVFITPTSDYFTKTIAPYNATIPWRVTQIDGIKDVTLDVVSSSAGSTNVVVDVVGTCDQEEIIDLVTPADFIIENVSTGALIVPTVLARVGNTYTLTASVVVATDYYIYRKTADEATDKGYETYDYKGAIVKTEFTAGA